jgi:hypothetical protein
VAAAIAQEGTMDMKPPKEMSLAAFLLGNWTGSMTFYDQGKTTKSTGTIVGKRALGGRYVSSDHTYRMGGMTMTGMHLLTYDPSEKAWKAWWFDSAAPGAMELTGDFSGNKLVMTSKPTPIPGMPNPASFRATWVKVSAKKLDFTLEMKGGETWGKVIVGSYSKK